MIQSPGRPPLTPPMPAPLRFPGPMLAVVVVGWLAGCATIPAVQYPSLSLRGSAGQWVAKDGSRFPCHVWMPPSRPPAGVVIGVHGLGGATSDFRALGEALAAKGIAFHAYELRGQGNDPDKTHIGDIPSAHRWIDDLRSFDALVRGLHPGLPVIWLGESLGSLIICNTVTSQPPEGAPAALVLVSPVPGFDRRVGLVQRQLLGLAALTRPARRVPLAEWARRDPSKWQVTGQTDHLGQMAQTPWAVDSFTLRFYHQLAIMIGRMKPQARSITQPVLVLNAGKDVFALAPLVEKFTGLLRKGEQRFYPESHHLLFYDHDRERVVRDITSWCRVQVREARR